MEGGIGSKPHNKKLDVQKTEKIVEHSVEVENKRDRISSNAGTGITKTSA